MGSDATPSGAELCLTAEQMRAVDGSVEALGLPSLLLMENAGRGIADAMRAHPRWPGRGARVCVVTGGGNNGGDGFVIARHLALAGASVGVVALASAERLKGDALAMGRAFESARLGAWQPAEDATWDGLERWRQALESADVVVDAIFGTGLARDVAGRPRVALAAMNATRAWKVAVDVPSGLDGDTGRVKGLAFEADTTFTIGARKLGLALAAGGPAGEVRVVPLGIPIRPPAALAPFASWQDGPPVHDRLPREGATAHKGRAGHLLLIAASPGKTGAGLLASRAAFRAGAGLVTIASTRATQVALDAKVAEAMTAVFSEGADADEASVGRVQAWLAAERYRAMAIGPGIPTGPGMQALVTALARDAALPTVIDADGLNLLGPERLAVLREAAGPRVLTPHPGEAARLLRTDVPAIEHDRPAAVRRLAHESGAIVVLKGARTLIADPSGEITINDAATGALATAGSGDVLTGMVGAFLAQGVPGRQAACLAVYWHGRAGGWCEARRGVGVMAGDLPDAVARLMAGDRRSGGRGSSRGRRA